MKLKYPNDRFDIRRKDVFFSDFAPAADNHGSFTCLVLA